MSHPQRNTLEYTFDKITLRDEQGERYPNNENYPNIYDLCWVGKDLYLRAKLDRNDERSSLYQLKFRTSDFSGDFIPTKLLQGNNKDSSTMTRGMYCSTNDEGLYLLSYDNKLKYFDLKSNSINNISDAWVVGVVSGGDKLSFQDKQGNNFIMKLK